MCNFLILFLKFWEIARNTLSNNSVCNHDYSKYRNSESDKEIAEILTFSVQNILCKFSS